MVLRRSRASIAAGVLFAVAIVAIAPSFAATERKPYSAVFAPASVPGSNSVAMSLTLTNRANPQTLGSANVTAPSGFTITAATVHSTGSTGDTTFPTTLLKLRNLAIAPGTSRTVSMTVSTPCATGDYTWGIRAKQSNDFSGPPGNDFSGPVEPSNLRTTVTAGPAASLAFTTQPGDGQVATPGNPTVAVTVRDACGNPTQTTGQVALSLVPPADTAFGGDGALGGTTAVAPTNGVASFTNLTVSKSGQGYALDATYNGVTARSSTFSIYDFFGACTAPSGCGTSDATTSITVGPSSGGNVGLSLKAGSTATCGGLEVVGSSSAFTVVPPPGHTKFDIPVTLTISKPGLQGVGVANIVVCKNSGPGTELVALGKCPKKGAPTSACIVSQTSSNAGDAVIKFLINSVDPGGAGFA